MASGAAVKGVGGKKGRSGRKSRAEELGLQALLDQCFTPEARAACIRKLAEDCEASDFHQRHESRKLLLAYAFGKPTEKHEHSGEGGGPITLKVIYASPRTNDNAASPT